MTGAAATSVDAIPDQEPRSIVGRKLEGRIVPVTGGTKSS